MRVITVIIALAAFWLAGCSARRGITDQYASRVPDPRRLTVSVTNGTPEFRQYDHEFADTVQHRWYDLLDVVALDGYQAGEVIVGFKLHADGRITDIGVKKNSASPELGLLCQKAILDPQPYEPWSPELRRAVGEDYRHITFSFYYK
jgi:hypothetical protein